MQRRVRDITIAALAVSLLVLLWVRLGGNRPVQLDSGYGLMMGTVSRVVVVAPNLPTARRCIEAAFLQQQQIESLMSYHRQDSELSQVNRSAFDAPVEVSPWTFEVLKQAKHFAELSSGAFDVTVGPLVDLWRRAGDTNTPPSKQELVRVRSQVGYDKLLLNETDRTVRFAVQGMKVDLGGIAKGFAVDKSVEAMKQAGALAGMVDLGGNIRCFGKPLRRDYWLIGVQDPNHPDDIFGTSPPVSVLKLGDASIATSGGYRRFNIVQGRSHSHIIDPSTGASAEQLAGVTIVASDATSADALSTAVSVLGAEKGLALIESLPDVEAILIPAGKDAGPIFSTGAGKYVEK